MDSWILFVSEINALSSKTTSTHILTENIIYGFKQNGYRVVFIALCETDEAYLNVKKYYSDKVDRLYMVKSRFGSINNKYKKLLCMIKGAVFGNDYEKIIPDELEIEDNTILVSHTPSLEAAFLCKAIRKKHKSLRYIQYWSDPIALSGIMPEQFGLKRKPFYWLEKYAFGFADEIVFGTKTLFEINAELYPKFLNKMRFVDLAYLQKDDNSAEISKSSKEFIYAGNYYSAIRDIKPLYDAFNELGDEYKLNIYGSGDLDLADTNNIKFHQRISPDELAEIEGTYRNTISLLNHSCMQIPGKTFYQTDTNQIIFVIADGIHKEALKDYLSNYDRFIICDNDKKEIKGKILEISKIRDYKCPQEIKKRLSAKVVSQSIVLKSLINT